MFLAHRPDIQQHAYNEIERAGVLKDEAFGTGEVEYIRALTKEFMRYYTVLPLAMPRETTADAYYEGYTIPKNTIVFLNAWGCNRGSYMPPSAIPHVNKAVHEEKKRLIKITY